MANLDELCRALSDDHPTHELCQSANEALTNLRAALDDYVQAYRNRGRRTSLQEWDKLMKAADEQARAVLWPPTPESSLNERIPED